MFAEVHVSLGKAGIFQAYNFDLGVLFNFKLLNTVICIFFFFLNFFRWNKLQAFSYENFFFIIILLLIF